MTELSNFQDRNTISSVHLVEKINHFRKEEGNETVLLHKSLLTKIESEFSEEISEQIILPSSYLGNNNKYQKCYELEIGETLQLLMRESKTVRKKCVDSIMNKQSTPVVYNPENKLPQTKKEWIQFSLEQEEVIEQQQLLITEQTPKVIAFENVIDSANTYTLDSISDILNIGRTTLCRILEQKKWKTVRETNGTSSTRYAEENGYAKTIYEYVKVKGKDIKTKRFVLKKKGLDKLIKEQQNGSEFN